MEKMFYPDKIQIFIDEVSEQIKDSLNPEYIILSGSFGKNSWLYFDNKLISDFEFVFVCKNKWSIKKKKKLLKFFNNKYQYDISLKGFLISKVENKIQSNYSKRNAGYISLDFFDTFQNPIILYNKDQRLLNVKLTSDEIPVWEAWRLCVNRLGDFLKLEFNQESHSNIDDYYWLKIFESIADAFCIVNNIYNKDIDKRIDAFKLGVINYREDLNKTCIDSFNIISNALESRKKHDLLNFKIDMDLKRRNEIVNSWMDYFEERLCIEEGMIYNKETFHQDYLKNRKLQMKYLGFKSDRSIVFSNMIRLLYNRSLISSDFRFNNHSVSWRHIILLSISSIYKEYTLGVDEFNNSEVILKEILKLGPKRTQSSEEFISLVLGYWKMLR